MGALLQVFDNRDNSYNEYTGDQLRKEEFYPGLFGNIGSKEKRTWKLEEVDEVTRTALLTWESTGSASMNYPKASETLVWGEDNRIIRHHIVFLSALPGLQVQV